MAGGIMDVVVRFIGDASSMQSEAAKVEGTAAKLNTTFKSLAKTAALAFGGVALIGFAKDAVGAATDLNESMNKVNVVFGKSAGQIRAFTQTAADSLGLSRQQALDAAGAYGNMFTQLGLTTDQAANMSKGMLRLTADLASFHNADPTDVLEAQSAAFRGEYDALQKFIPTISAATVEQEAMKETGKTSADQLTASEKAAATYTLMVQGAGAATGDFARTSGEAANQQRIMAAKTDDASASIGQALQPALAVIVPMIADLASGFANAAPDIQNATVALAAFGAIALAVGGPIGLIIAALGLIVTTAVLVWTNWDQIWNWIKDHPAYAVIISILAAPIAWFILIIGALKTLWENWDTIWGWIKQAATDAKNWIVGAFNDVVAFFQRLPGTIAGALSGLFDILTAPFLDAWHTIEGVAGDIKDAFNTAIGFVKGIWNGFARSWNGISIHIPSVDLPIVGEVGGGTVSLPNLPILDTGGIISKPTLALLAMNNRAEAVVPLDRMRDGANYTINVTVASGVNPAAVGAATVDAIRSYERVAGKSWRAG